MAFLNPKRDNIGTIAVVIIAMQLIIVSATFYGFYYLITNPEVIGEFLGKISNGYNQTK